MPAPFLNLLSKLKNQKMKNKMLILKTTCKTKKKSRLNAQMKFAPVVALD